MESVGWIYTSTETWEELEGEKEGMKMLLI